jgi:prepilin-type N-terminal cleavage/methylation domain-containing protein
LPTALERKCAVTARHTGKHECGFTLPEVLTATIVIGLIVGCISAVYMASLRTWYRGATEDYAQQKASWAVQRMQSDIRQGLSVLPGSPPNETSYIALRLPSRVFDTTENTYLNQVAINGEGALYLVPGGWVLYYRGDADGHADRYGDRIWRRAINPNGTVARQYVVAENVVDNPIDGTGTPKPMFIYWPDIYRLRSVEVTVTVEERLGNRTSQATMNSEFTLRNN